MVSTRQFETDQSGSYGNAQHPECFPAKEALKLARMAKAVDLLVEHPAPTVFVLSKELRLSRATVYRMFAEQGFQMLLRKALEGRIGLVARRAMDVVEKAMEEGSPALRFKAATWLLERHHKLGKLAAEDDAKFRGTQAAAQLRAMLASMDADRAGSASGSSGGALPLPPEEQSYQEAAKVAVLQARTTADELADAELLDDGETGKL